jgi:hypothetical protein
LLESDAALTPNVAPTFVPLVAPTQESLTVAPRSNPPAHAFAFFLSTILVTIQPVVARIFGPDRSAA